MFKLSRQGCAADWSRDAYPVLLQEQLPSENQLPVATIRNFTLERPPLHVLRWKAGSEQELMRTQMRVYVPGLSSV
eukprot:359602-Chlamydomonas_euryale.AAC.8